MVSMYSDPVDAYTQVATYTVPEAQHQALRDLLVQAANSWLRLLPRFLSANVYLSSDRTHLVFQVEWRTQEDWLNARQHPEQTAIASKIHALGGTLEADERAYSAPVIIKGPMAPTGLVMLVNMGQNCKVVHWPARLSETVELQLIIQVVIREITMLFTWPLGLSTVFSLF